MKVKNKIQLILAGIIILVYPCIAQTTYEDKINNVFQHVDKSRITTGLLYDYGLQIIDPSFYDGIILVDSNYVDDAIWKTLYWGMYSSKVNGSVSLQQPDLMNQNIDNQSDNSLMVMHLKYDKYKENAVNSGLVTVMSEQIYDVSGQNPYEQKMIFAVAPKQKYFTSKTVELKFNSSLFVNNTGKTVSQLKINFNNESGYLSASWNTPLSYTFATAGIKDVYFRITYSDNTTYTSRAKISVWTPPVRTLSGNNMKHVIDATSEHLGGEVQIRLSSRNTSQKIKKPLIVAEGFDPSAIFNTDNRNISHFLDSIITGSVHSISNQIDVQEYDIIYLDYKNGVDDIRRNAKLFREVIEYVNRNKEGGQPNVVMGISMGGLVARYALRKMEIDGVEHDTWKYISVDSPHKGANIPIGYQTMLRHINDFKVSIGMGMINVFKADYVVKEVGQAKQLLNSTAAKQMLIYYVNSNGAIDNSEHNSFQSEYDNLGMPKRCENIAITNGAGNGALNFNPGSNIMQYDMTLGFDFWLNIAISLSSGIFAITNFPQLIALSIPGKSEVVSSITVNATPNRSTSLLYSGNVKIRKTILWLIPITITTLTNFSLNSNTSIYPVDGAPGGKYDVKSVAGEKMTDLLKIKYFTFIPTVSALNLSNWQSMLTSNLSSTSTDFIRNYKPNFNEDHTLFLTNTSFLLNELSATPVAAQITGTVNITSNKQYNRNIVVKNGGILNINSSTVNALKITVENGGTVNLVNGGKINCTALDTESSGKLNTETGSIVSISL